MGAAPVFTCPMHPEVQADAAGSCPACGMALEAATPQIARILDLIGGSPDLTGATVRKDLAGRDRVVTARRNNDI